VKSIELSDFERSLWSFICDSVQISQKKICHIFENYVYFKKKIIEKANKQKLCDISKVIINKASIEF
jgi:hypothetical protein